MPDPLHPEMKERTARLQSELAAAGLDAALFTDPDSIAWFTGFRNWLGVEFRRPTMLLVGAGGDCALVTPLMESAMARAMAWVADIHPWEDGRGAPWGDVLLRALGRPPAGLRLGVEADRLPALVGGWLDEAMAGAEISDIAAITGRLRMIKSAAEIGILREAGEVAVAMVGAGRAAIAEGVPEYEVALAVLRGGTEKGAALLAAAGIDNFTSPTVHNLQILQSGHDTSLVHRRSSLRRLQRGEPVYLCFCGMVNHRGYKPGFDREFFLGGVSDAEARVYEVAIAAQRAALEMIRPGVIAEDVHEAACEVYRTAGHAPGYRTGRAIGASFIEAPELTAGDTTRLEAGMAFAVDGGITIPGEFGARVGDTVVVTEDGYEVITPYPSGLTVL